MSTQSTNLGLIKDASEDFYNIEKVNANLDLIDAAVGDNSEIKVAGGTGTAITLNIPSISEYKAYRKISFIASANNAGNATTIKVNALAAKQLYKPNTTAAPNLIQGKAYDVWYDSTGGCFFLKASAEGTATKAQVLADATYSTQDDTGLIGEMPNNGSVGTQTLATHNAEYTIPAGYHNGLGKVKAVITGILASVIKAGVTVGGILGTFTSDATALAAEILATKTGYVNGVKLTGSMVNRNLLSVNGYTTARSVKPDGGGNLVFEPETGFYSAGVNSFGYGSLIANDPDYVAANFPANKNIFGLQGAIPVRSGNWQAPNSVFMSGGALFVLPPAGLYDGVAPSYVKFDEPDLIPSNVKAGVDILGVVGTAVEAMIGGTIKELLSVSYGSLTVHTNMIKWRQSQIDASYPGRIYRINSDDTFTLMLTITNGYFFPKPFRFMSTFIWGREYGGVSKHSLDALTETAYYTITHQSLYFDDAGFFYAFNVVDWTIKKFNETTGALVSTIDITSLKPAHLWAGEGFFNYGKYLVLRNETQPTNFSMATTMSFKIINMVTGLVVGVVNAPRSILSLAANNATTMGHSADNANFYTDVLDNNGVTNWISGSVQKFRGLI